MGETKRKLLELVKEHTGYIIANNLSALAEHYKKKTKQNKKQKQKQVTSQIWITSKFCAENTN